MITAHNLLSRPVRLHWAGWETDTYRLQQAGWQLSAEQDIYEDRLRIAMQHPAAQMQGLTAGVDFRYREMLQDFSGEALRHITLPVHLMSRRVEVQTISGSIDWSFKPIDAMPQFSQREIRRLEDLAHFAAPLARTEQLIVPHEDVDTLMKRILELQQPDRIERIKRDLREQGMGADRRQQAVHAQIISYPVAA